MVVFVRFFEVECLCHVNLSVVDHYDHINFETKT